MASVPSLDQTIGPILSEKNDFTLRFEDWIFTILPSILLIIATPFSIKKLVQQPPAVGSGILLWAKLVTSLFLLCAEVGNIILWSISAEHTEISLVAASLSSASAFCIIAMLYVEHVYSLRSSTLISVYLSITLLFSIAKTRSYFIRDTLQGLGGVEISAAVLKLVILILEEVSKRGLVNNEAIRRAGYETFSGFWNRALFLWLNSTFMHGYRALLDINDLQALPLELTSERLYREFAAVWDNVRKDSKFSLLWASIRALGSKAYAPFFPYLLFLALCYAQPFLVQRIVLAIKEPDLPNSIIGGIIGAIGILYFAIAITQNYAQHLVNKQVTALRGHLVTAIYQKVLRLDQVKLRESAALTLMSTDVEGVGSFTLSFHIMWSAIFSVCAGTYILSLYIGVAAIFVLIPVCITTLLSAWISKKLRPARKIWNEKIGVRVSGVSDALQQVKTVKITGLDDVVAMQLQELLHNEIDAACVSRQYATGVSGLSEAAELWTPIIVVAGGLFWTRSSTGFSTADIFASLSVVAIVADPLFMLVMGASEFAASLASFERIQDFLLLDELTDTRTAARSNHPVGRSSLEKQQYRNSLLNVTIDHISTKPLKDGRQILRDLTVYIPAQLLTMIIGVVGCGKSTLLNAILGEEALIEGQIHVNKDEIVYCGQKPWIQNTSIKYNIVGENPFSEQLYEATLYACALLEDIDALPNGDETIVGTNGCRLSGGQKLRVGLGRALYANKGIVILDDIFSGLDRATARSIFRRLFGPQGVLRASQSTIIMTTNLHEHLAEADQVLRFTQTGELHRVSNPDEFEQADYLTHEADLDSTETTSNDDRNKEKEIDAADNVEEERDGNHLARQQGDVSLWWYYLKSYGFLRIALWILCASLTAGMERSPAIYIRIWLTVDPTNRKYFAGYAAFGVTTVLLCIILSWWYNQRLITTSYKNFHWGLVTKVMSATLSFLSITDTGTLLNRFSQDMLFIGRGLPTYLLRLVYSMAGVATDLGIIASGAQYAPIIIPFVLFFFYVLQHFYLRTSRQLRHLDLETKSPLYTLFMETSNGAAHIRAFTWETHFKERVMALLDISQKTFYNMYCIQQWLQLVLDMLVTVIAITVVALALFLRKHVGTTQASVGLALLNLITFSQSATNSIRVWVEVETALGAIARLKLFSEQTPSETDQHITQEQEAQLENWPSSGHIELLRMCARYTDNDPDSPRVLNGITFSVKHGQRLAIRGRTGSGKTSLALSLLHLLEYSGSIKIDGVELRTIPRKLLRSRITTISQDALELRGSVRFNAFPFKCEIKPSDDFLVGMMHRVGIWDHILSLGGLDADFQALELSPGQRQLFGIARAMAHHVHTGSKIVIFDEPTSFLDPERESQLQEAMNAIFVDCTVLVVTHRENTVANADLIATMSQGQVTSFTDKQTIRGVPST